MTSFDPDALMAAHQVSTSVVDGGVVVLECSCGEWRHAAAYQDPRFDPLGVDIRAAIQGSADAAVEHMRTVIQKLREGE